MPLPEIKHNSESLFSEISNLIEESRKDVAVTVNAALTMLYWNVGKLINDEILQNQRVDYGKQIVYSLSKKLTEQFGSGWSEQHLRHCLRSAETMPQIGISINMKPKKGKNRHWD
jgi:hypothetical protein